ncbi:adenine phosphoribosyltransferase [Eubacterium minutum ATCC 700079]|nr:adenine phosphoribosyltransferase [Eubacterium minutum ATCC 700079]
MFYEMKIAGLERELPLCPINDELYIGAFVMFGDVEITCAAASELLKKAPEFDVIVTAESKGIPLAYEMARQSGDKDYVVCRKAQKLYMLDIIETVVDSITTDNVQKLCLGQSDIALLENRRVLIVDDVISTGESLKSIEKLLEQIDCSIAGKMAVLAEGDAINRDDIIYLEELPLFNPDGSVK